MAVCGYSRSLEREGRVLYSQVGCQAPPLPPSSGGGKWLSEASGGAGAQGGGALPYSQGRELYPHIQCHNITGFRQEQEQEKDQKEKEKEQEKEQEKEKEKVYA